MSLRWSTKKHQEWTKIVYHGGMVKPLRLELDRSAKTPLAEQIRRGIGAAIESGVLAPGARLPSWQDLAVQLGVARGTVRSAYEKLSAAQLIVASRATGTHVAARPSIAVRLALVHFQTEGELAPTPGCYAVTSWRRMESGRPAASIRFSTATPMAASVCWAAKPRARSRGPISAF